MQPGGWGGGRQVCPANKPVYNRLEGEGRPRAGLRAGEIKEDK